MKRFDNVLPGDTVLFVGTEKNMELLEVLDITPGILATIVDIPEYTVECDNSKCWAPLGEPNESGLRPVIWSDVKVGLAVAWDNLQYEPDEVKMYCQARRILDFMEKYEQQNFR